MTILSLAEFLRVMLFMFMSKSEIPPIKDHFEGNPNLLCPAAGWSFKCYLYAQFL